MRRRFVSLCAVFTVALLWASAACGQVVPSAQSQSGALAFGSGLSSWNPDVGSGRMLGITAWSDYHPPLPSFLDGLGAELQARNVSWHRSGNQPTNLRQATFGGGPIYRWNRYRTVQPYGKFIFSFGGMDFHVPGATYSHDTRTVLAPGGGLQVRAYRNLWARFDYEYQIWHPPIDTRGPLHPQGFTLGLSWDARGFQKPRY
jgi:opacity protein-like surface antigen